MGRLRQVGPAFRADSTRQGELRRFLTGDIMQMVMALEGTWKPGGRRAAERREGRGNFGPAEKQDAAGREQGRGTREPNPEDPRRSTLSRWGRAGAEDGRWHHQGREGSLEAEKSGPEHPGATCSRCGPTPPPTFSLI